MSIEDLHYEEPGYQPLVMTQNWQLAQLNFEETQLPENIVTLDRHVSTDETFTLLKGRAILLTYDEETKEENLTPMMKGHTYNVPTMTWHNIIMEQGSSVVITENRDTHLENLQQLDVPKEIQYKLVEFSNSTWKEINDTIKKSKGR